MPTDDIEGGLRALIAAIERLRLENRILREREELRTAAPGALLGESPVIREARTAIETLAAEPDPVFIEGERGVGKRLAAALLHYRGPRRAGLLVTSTCRGTSGEEIERDLLGHEGRPGLVATARGGTLLLLHADELPPPLAEAMAAAAHESDTRLVLTAAGTEDDLPRRLGATVLRLPPLRTRREDIPILARSFVERLAVDAGSGAAALGGGDGALGRDEMRALAARSWPGNVRELGSAVERLVLDRLVAGHNRGAVSAQETLHAMMERYERTLIDDALRDSAGNKTHAAAALGITREGLHKKLARYRNEI